jgi:hypothetical protein
MNGLASALTGLLLLTTSGAPLSYRFLEVKSKVVVGHEGVERRAVVGDSGVAGDEVRTGWWGHAVVEVTERASRFEILPSTRVVLGGPEPGILVVVERGRLKAVFDALTGNQERLVATPGALLAVRGTRYGVEVAADGSATLAVFEGTVEVLPTAAGFSPTAVHAGEACRFGPQAPPQRGPLPKGVDEQGWRGGIDSRGGDAASRGAQPGAGDGPGAPGASSRQTGQGKRGGGGG